MAADQARTPTPQEPVCDICRNPIRAEQYRVTVQEQHYHARCCYERSASRATAGRRHAAGDREPLPVMFGRRVR
jgi:hypothetical protein